jgi:hypothetical protein
MAVSYLVLPDSVPFARQLAAGQAEAKGYERQPANTSGQQTSVYKTPWEPIEAFLTDAGSLPAIGMPYVKYRSAEQRAQRDSLVRQYADLAYSDESTPVEVEYPSAEELRLRLEDVVAAQYLIIAENWDSTWRARTGDGESLDVRRFGPNYLAVDVSELRGDVVVELHHDMPWHWKFGIALTVLSLPLAVGMMVLERRASRSSS